MNARMMMLTVDGSGPLETSGVVRSWLATALDWPLLMRRIREVQSGARSGWTAAGDNALRRQRDRHPDAPPRRPLLASRDLPPVGAIHGFRAPVITPVAAPRSPAPMSDAEIAQLMAAATARPIANRLMADLPTETFSPAPLPALPTMAHGPESDAAAIEAALDKALATLRKLAEQTQAKRRR